MVMKHPHLLESADAVIRFAFAGKARLTFESRATFARFTYRIKKSDDGQVWFVSVLNGSDNETSYTYLGFVKNEVYTHGRKSKISEDAPSAKAFKYVMGNILDRNRVPEQVRVWHEGSCGRCGRALTVPESIRDGIGPECRKHVFSCEPTQGVML
jgi:hypothetical protein